MSTATPIGPPLPTASVSSWLAALPRAVRFNRHPLSTLIERETSDGAPFGLATLMAGPVWVLATPGLAHEVLHAPPGRYRAGRANRRILPILPPDTVLTLDGDEHRARRRLLAPLFHGDSLALMAPIIRDVVDGELGRWPLGVPFEVLPLTRFMTLCVAARLLLGVEGQVLVRDLERNLSRALHPYTLLAGVGGLRRLGPASPQSAARRCRAAFGRGVAEVRAARAPRSPGGPPDALDVLCAGGSLDDARVADELFALLLAGHETTATALAWGIELLAFDPVTAAALAAEAGGEERPRLEAVISEVLRLRPPLVDIVREAAVPVRLAGRELPAGTLVLIAPPLVHRHEHDNPDAFSPDRFLGRRPDPRTWLPFGGGDRRCLGASLALLELREILPRILEQFELHPAGDRLPVARLHGTALVPDRRAQIILQPR
jgi:cytochrome P450